MDRLLVELDDHHAIGHGAPGIAGLQQSIGGLAAHADERAEQDRDCRDGRRGSHQEDAQPGGASDPSLGVHRPSVGRRSPELT